MVARVVDLRKGKSQPREVSPLPFARRPEPPRRVSPLKQKRRRARLAAFGMIVIGICAVAYTVHALSYMRAMSVSGVRVVGTDKIEPSIIETYVDAQLTDDSLRYFSKRNIFLYPKEAIEAGIVATFPRVKAAALSRTALFSQELVVNVQEREQYALWCRGEADCYALDESGFIFTSLATSTGAELRSIYRFSGGLDAEPIGAALVPKHFDSTLHLLRTLQDETGLIPHRIELLRDGDLTVAVTQGFYIKASLGQDAVALARNLELVLTSDALRDRIADIEYVDMRFGNRVYYKMKGEEQAGI
jgi:cell division septal protein FtsQ